MYSVTPYNDSETSVCFAADHGEEICWLSLQTRTSVVGGRWDEDLQGLTRLTKTPNCKAPTRRRGATRPPNPKVSWFSWVARKARNESEAHTKNSCPQQVPRAQPNPGYLKVYAGCLGHARPTEDIAPATVSTWQVGVHWLRLL